MTKQISKKDLQKTTQEWLEKFNPYHDELGRFTHAPGGAAGVKPVSVLDKEASDIGDKLNAADVLQGGLTGDYEGDEHVREVSYGLVYDTPDYDNVLGEEWTTHQQLREDYREEPTQAELSEALGDEWRVTDNQATVGGSGMLAIITIEHKATADAIRADVARLGHSPITPKGTMRFSSRANTANRQANATRADYNTAIANLSERRQRLESHLSRLERARQESNFISSQSRFFNTMEIGRTKSQLLDINTRNTVLRIERDQLGK